MIQANISRDGQWLFQRVASYLPIEITLTGDCKKTPLSFLVIAVRGAELSTLDQFLNSEKFSKDDSLDIVHLTAHAKLKPREEFFGITQNGGRYGNCGLQTTPYFAPIPNLDRQREKRTRRMPVAWTPAHLMR